MKYEAKSFTVPAGSQQRTSCASHTEPWLDRRGRCVLCGETVGAPSPPPEPLTEVEPGHFVSADGRRHVYRSTRYL